ncbi:MAG: CPBP family intramembrane metalloprotease [candidate division Zixibacteria bacterium]|nr:CPBP family intramembrane metalloprotease [candidate division Zixibacteria bacterium]
MTDDNYNFDLSPDNPNGWETDGGENQERMKPTGKPFRKSKVSYFTLLFLLVIWPVMSVAFVGDPSQMLRMLSVSPIVMVYLPTIVIQWLVFGLIWIAVWREGTGLAGLGFKRIRTIDFAWAIAFLIVSNLLLTLLSVLLAKINLEIPSEIDLILPKTMAERIIWVFLSLTAGICEETIFRGYLLTRIRIFGRFKNWIAPVLIASLAFGSGHAYQGAGGFILITVYGIMFALLFIKTKTLWPCVIAHFLQDAMALFYTGSG